MNRKVFQPALSVLLVISLVGSCCPVLSRCGSDEATDTPIPATAEPTDTIEPTESPTEVSVVTPTVEQPTESPTQPPPVTPTAEPTPQAPPLDRTVATNLSTASEFLYTGEDPIQTGVEPGTIDPVRVAVLRGRVLDREDNPLPEVRISILDHPELGETLSRADGMFDLAVNGGGPVTLVYEKEGFLAAQRQVEMPWQDYVWAPDVILIPADPQVTTVDLGQTAEEVAVARGSEVTDEDGTRQATLLFPKGIVAEMVLSDGSTQPLPELSVRATEFTVGENGPQAMPAELPPESGYTYAVELSVDEAQAAGATDVQFDRPLYYYVEDFIGFPVGSPVPVGYYDRDNGQWIPSPNGIVMEVLGISDDKADLDTDGDGAPDDSTTLAALDITDAERVKIGSLYPETPQRLWRVPITHFSPWDFNWPYGLPDDAESPPSGDPFGGGDGSGGGGGAGAGGGGQGGGWGCQTDGSIIGCQPQILGERISLAGSPFRLNYRSDRVRGRKEAYTLDIPLSGEDLPASLSAIRLEITVAGQKTSKVFNRQPNQTYTFTWDGNDGNGRPVQGPQPATVRLGYQYPAVYRTPQELEQSFGQYGGADIETDTREGITIWQEWQTTIGAWDATAQGLGGWSLDVHHVYDVVGRVLHLGDGDDRSAESLQQTITTVAGTGQIPQVCLIRQPIQASDEHLREPHGVAVGADGTLYIADAACNKVWQVGVDGNVVAVFGAWSDTYFGGDGGPASEAYLHGPHGIAVGPDGSLYIADTGNNRIRRVYPDGIITTVAGNGTSGYGGDGGPATEAQLAAPYGIAVGSDGSLYIGDRLNHRVRRVGPDDIITTVAGNGFEGFSGDGGPATQARLRYPEGVDVGPDGSVYIADTGNHAIRRVRPDGAITTVAGTGGPRLIRGDETRFTGDGGPATQARLAWPADVAVGPDGSLYIADRDNNRVRWVEPGQTITTTVGSGPIVGLAGGGFDGDRGPATRARLNQPRGVATGPDGSLYVVDTSNRRIRRVLLPLPGFSVDDIVLASEDGREIYVFDGDGRHLRTLNALSGAVLYRFSYDENGLLIQIEDRDGNVTVVERDADGTPQAIVGPYGQRTALDLDDNGYLEQIINPLQEAYAFAYTTDGLLVEMTDPRQNTRLYFYDELGRLERAEDPDPAGGFQTLERTDLADGFEVTRITALHKATTYRVERLRQGVTRWLNTFPDHTQAQAWFFADGRQRTTTPDGLVSNLQEGPDPRFGMQSPLPESLSVETPGGLYYTASTERMVTLADPYDPLSLETQTDATTINGRTYTNSFDATANLVTSTTPEGRQMVTILDDQGRVVAMQVADLEPVSITYDERGRPVSLATGAGSQKREYRLDYNEQGYPGSITDPLSRTVSLDYDAAGRITGQTLPDSRVITYGYDANGNLSSLTPPGRPGHAFTYNALDLLETYVPPDVGAGAGNTSYAYNADRQLDLVTRPDGAQIDPVYDAAGRLSSLVIPRGTIEYEYERGTGNLAGITAPDDGTLTFSYDGPLVTGMEWLGTVGGSVAATYDDNFRVASLGVNGGYTVTFDYDGDGLLTRSGSLTLTRDAQHGLVTGSVLGGVDDTRTYNAFGEIAQYQATYDGSDLLDILYTRDRLGRIATMTETVQGATTVYSYTYDLSGRLTEVTKDDITVSTYTYDSNGNRLSYTGPEGTVTGTYDDQDRLLQYGNTTYTYTANGEVLTKTVATTGETTTYQYDVLGNLMGVTLPDKTEIEYVVDGLNRRIGKRVDGELVQGFLHKDWLNPVAELDGDGNVVARFVYASKSNVPDYMERDGRTYRILSDHLGSPWMVIDTATGNVVQRIDYDEFGNILTDTNPGFQPFGFAGGLYDPLTGLTRFGARDYDSEIGRWTARDAMVPAGSNTNRYVYALNDPVNLLDLNGFEPTSSQWNTVTFVNLIGTIAGALAYILGASGGTAIAIPALTAVWGLWYLDCFEPPDWANELFHEISDLIPSTCQKASGWLYDNIFWKLDKAIRDSLSKLYSL